jgi:hypothetical protein
MPLRNRQWSKSRCIWLVAALTSAACVTQSQAPVPGTAQNAAPAAIPDTATSQPAPFKPEEIEALVAPVALYPDSVLAQVLMASTYPLEIVNAARWVKSNPNIKGDAALKAVENQPWDVSVKSLVAFPQILEPMNDKLDWTQKLGDAFLAQEKDVLAAVQRLRARAKDSGNLKSNEQQNVIVELAPDSAAGAASAETIVIEPADAQVIYVPAYNPTVVYGAWSYPAYPPYYWTPYSAYYPGAALATGFAWGIGLAAAGAIYSNCNWGGGDVNINVEKAANIDRNFDRNKVQRNGNRWQHDAGHRQGVAYRDNATRQRYAGNVAGADARSQYRGRNTGGSDRAVADRSGMGNRADGGSVSRASDRAGGFGGGGGYTGGGRDNAFQGVGAGQASQRNADRGRSSMQGAGFSRGGGGGMRGGGGRGRR